MVLSKDPVACPAMDSNRHVSSSLGQIPPGRSNGPFDQYLAPLSQILTFLALGDHPDVIFSFLRERFSIPLEDPEVLPKIYYLMTLGEPIPAVIGGNLPVIVVMQPIHIQFLQRRWARFGYEAWKALRFRAPPGPNPPLESSDYPFLNASNRPTILANSTTSHNVQVSDAPNLRFRTLGPPTFDAADFPLAHLPVGPTLLDNSHTNDIERTAMAPNAIPPPLPPSVEEAYKRKCIDLKRRMTEVETSNDAYRLRKVRLMRGIRKMRLERAYLLEMLGKRMRKNGTGVDGLNGTYDEDSEGSSESPPTPQEKPLRTKRGHRRPLLSPPPTLQQQISLPSNLSQSQPYSTPIAPQPPVSFIPIPATNGTPITPFQPQLHPHPPTQPYLSPNPHSNHPRNYLPSLQTQTSIASPQRPLLPRESFARSLIHNQILPHRGSYDISDEEIPAFASQAWDSLPAEERRTWVRRYELDMGQFEADNEATINRSSGGVDGVERDRDIEMDMEEERLAEYDAERGRQRNEEGASQVEHENRNGVGSGFTAVNG